MLHMKWLEKHFTMFKMRFARSDIHLAGRLDDGKDRESAPLVPACTRQRQNSIPHSLDFGISSFFSSPFFLLCVTTT
jgi:hypothetical protein